MQNAPKPPRILFLDMMRFVALAMMLQGHTVYAVLEHGIRDGDTSGISIWRFFRGYTAPVFMTVSGVVFTYLLVLAGNDRGELTRRLRHGALRVVTLIAWGYALRLPIEGLWKPVSQRLLDVGLATDVLQLIGFGLLVIVTVFLACRPVLRQGIERISWVFLVLFFGVVQITPQMTGRSFHRQVQPMFSPGGDGVTLENSSDPVGVRVVAIDPEKRDWGKGLIVGDVITAIGRSDIETLDDVPRAEARLIPDQPFVWILQRDGAEWENLGDYTRPVQAYPNVFSFWINRQPAPSAVASQFPVFPWTAYLLFGAWLGAALAGMNRKQRIPRLLDLILLGMAAALIVWAGFAENLGRIWLGGEETAIIFKRLGGVMLLAAAMVFLSRWIKRLPPLVIQMSRNSLWLYIGHLVLLYNIRPWIYHGKFEVAGTIACVLLMFALMIAQTWIIEKKRELGSWMGMARHLLRKVCAPIPTRHS
ncbi:MAG: heparan-alpha-glucosaminide N-acetyltransferase domain-containing protein [Luteolibacter sp.]